nr:hypothetical protein [Tanacetum cinerariifolium]
RSSTPQSQLSRLHDPSGHRDLVSKTLISLKCKHLPAFISSPSALGLRGRIQGDKNPGGRRDAGASSSAATKSSGCSNSGTNTGT